MKSVGKRTRLSNQRGQSFVEYLVILGIMIVLLVAFARGGFTSAMNNTLNSSANTMNTAQQVMSGVDLNQAKNW
jgi:Flp pilus assembly pilin Flp